MQQVFNLLFERCPRFMKVAKSATCPPAAAPSQQAYTIKPPAALPHLVNVIELPAQSHQVSVSRLPTALGKPVRYKVFSTQKAMR